MQIVRSAQVLAACLVLVAACGRADQKTAEKAPAPAPEAAPAPAPAAPPADWASLDGLVGKYPPESRIFEDSAVAPQLKTLLGPKLDVLKTNTQTSGPLQKEGGVYYLTGNKQHEGGSNEAYVLIDPATKALEVGLREDGKLTVYTTPGAQIAKPKDVQTMLANAG